MKNALRFAGLIAFLALLPNAQRKGRNRDLERRLRFSGHQRAACHSFDVRGRRCDGNN